MFILARMIETGVVKKYLSENCCNNKYVLCDRISKIQGESYQFLWDDSSALYDRNCLSTNWCYCWEEKNDNFGRLIKDIISSPHYCKQLSLIYLKDFFRQSLDFNIGVLIPMREHSGPQVGIEWKFENEINAYKSAKQYEKELWFKTISKIQLVMVILSLCIIIVLCCCYKRLKIEKIMVH